MNVVRVVVANEPRSYREVLAAVFRAVRPAAEVSTIAPRDLDGAVVRLAPHMVVCSEVTDAVRAHASSWVLLYPNGEDRAVVSIAGREATVAGIELACLLAALDQAL